MQSFLSRGAFVLALASIATLLQPAAGEAATVLRRGLVGPVETLDPQKAATVAETTLALDLFEGLVRRDGAGRLVPGAASAWDVSSDGLVYTFTLREGARWSNGDAVKAGDFVSSFRRLFDPATDATEDGPLQVIANAGAVKSGFAKGDALGVSAPDDSTLVIRLDKPTPTFIDRLAAPAALPVNVSASRKLGSDFKTGTKLVTNGAYGLSGNSKGVYTLARDAKRAGDSAAAIDTVTYRRFETAADCLAAYRSGEVDICPDAPTEKLEDLKAELGPALRIEPYAGTYFYAFNTTRPPFDDARVRRALSLAIDREALAASVWSGGMLPASSLVPAALQPKPSPVEPPIAARREEARSLLAAAGFGDRKPLTIAIRTGSGVANEATAAKVIADWKAVGVESRLDTSHADGHFAALRDKADFDIARAGWIADEPDALDFLEIFRSGGRFNYARYANPAFDRLVAAAETETDGTKRSGDIAEAATMLAKDAPVIPLLSYASLSIVSPKVGGWTANPLDQHPSRTLNLVD